MTENVTIVGPVIVEVTHEFPVVIYGIILGLGILIINCWLKSPILYLIASVFMFGVYHEPEIFDTYYQAGATLIIIFCWLEAFFNWRLRRNSYGGRWG